jgi:hypothetical protein
VTGKWPQIENDAKILHHKTKPIAATQSIIILNVKYEIPLVEVDLKTNTSVPGA